MKKYLKIFKVIGLVAFAILIANVNACSKKGSNNNNNPFNGGFGLPGGSIYGSGIGQTGDGAVLYLQFMVSPSGQAGAQGILTIPQQGLVGCAIPPGQYSVGTTVPGIISGGDTFSNIQLQANNGMPVMVAYATLFSQLIQNPYAGVSHQMFAITNIPGCPLTFD